MNVFDLVAKITLDTSEYDKTLKEKADEIDKGGGGGIKGALGSIAKTGALAFGAVGTAAVSAVSVLAKAAVSSYAEYEQLSGGVQKLFGEQASKTVMKYAQEAYKTAGMSANEYMETATGFAASLLQSVGGDSQKAAQITDVAMRSMSDNANTFGTDIESIKASYQGFAKQNYTMLDNLKLGYGGTKTEMERLIKDANKYRKAQGKNADLTIDSFADIVEAIQTVQEEQGIAGTTSKEAMTTIQGAADATKSAWQNVLTAIAGGGNLKSAMKGLISSIFGSGNGDGLLAQVIPRFKEAFSGIGEFITEIAPVVQAKLPKVLSDLIPTAISAASNLVSAVGKALPAALSGIWTAIKTAFTDNKDLFGEQGNKLLTGIKDGLSNALPQLVTAIGGILTSIGTWVTDNWDTIKTKGGEILSALGEGLSTAAETIGSSLWGIITGVGSWIYENRDTILQKGGEILDYIVEGIGNAVSNIGNGLLGLISAAASWIIANKDAILTTGKTIVTYIINGIVAAVVNIGQGFVSLVSNIASWVMAHSGDLLAVGQNILSWIVAGIKKWIEDIKAGFDNTVAKIKEKIDSLDFGAIGLQIITKIKNAVVTWLKGIAAGFLTLPSKIVSYIKTNLSFSGVGSAIINGIKNTITDNGLTKKIVGIVQAAVNAAKKVIPNWIKNGKVEDFNYGGDVGNGFTYAKAMHRPYLFNRGTVFGQYKGKDLIAGEAGAEMLLGTTTLESMLNGAVTNGMSASIGQLGQMIQQAQRPVQAGGNPAVEAEILATLQEYLPRLSQLKVVLNSGTVAGELAAGVDSALGSVSMNKARYNAG